MNAVKAPLRNILKMPHTQKRENKNIHFIFEKRLGERSGK